MRPPTGLRLGLTLAFCTVLAACAVAPPKPSPEPATVIARPEPPATQVAPIAHATAPGQPWASLIASFALNDCNDSPLVRSKLAMYTRSPARFEATLARSLPLMMYVQKQLHGSEIPGEFVMLPMLESSYNAAEPSHRGDPAGMWQLMPATARRHGVVVNHDYDGRLDPIASTDAAIKMLIVLGERFGDWRLADMAYNAGPHAVARAAGKHPDLGTAAIPDIPVSATTRKHLAKLMALSCILRQPERFHVKLPQPSPADQLMAIQVPIGLHLRDAAHMADLSLAKLRELNPGYLGSRIAKHSPGKLLLPAPAAASLAAALAFDNSEAVAQVDTSEQDTGPNDDLPLPEEPVPPQDGADTVASAPAPATHHRVRKGETLWSIAQHYDVSVRDLKRWNDLDDSDIHPGEELRVRG